MAAIDGHDILTLAQSCDLLEERCEILRAAIPQNLSKRMQKSFKEVICSS